MTNFNVTFVYHGEDKFYISMYSW